MDSIEMKEQMIQIMDDYTVYELHSMPLFSVGYADVLIAAGCILPRFKIEQEVWFVKDEKIFKDKIKAIRISKGNTIRFKLEQHEGTQLITLYESEKEAQDALIICQNSSNKISE